MTSGILYFAAACAAAAPQFIPALDARVKLVGRHIAVGSQGSVAFDWELFSASISVSNATYLNVKITDNSILGAKFAVYFNNTKQSSAWAPAPHRPAAVAHVGLSAGAGGDPNPHSADIPNMRILQFMTQNGSASYVLGNRANTGPPATWSIQLLTEPQFIGDEDDAHALVLDGFMTDGIVSPSAPVLSQRRIEILGDSLTAGYGSGGEGDLPFELGCGASNLMNDAGNSYGALLCANFSADCQIEAVSGITLETGHPNLPDLWPYELGSMYKGWANKVPFNASRWVPQAVLINLGENDWNGNCGSTPGCVPTFSAAYVSFVQTIYRTYNATGLLPPSPSPGSASGLGGITFFATIAPHEKGQSVGILPAVSTLQGLGYRVFFLNATVPESAYPPGCGGHPGPAIHRAAAQRAWPQIAQAMGWD